MSSRSDPWAARALVVLATGIAIVVAGDATRDRLASAFRFVKPVSVANARLDAWVTPPGYTGKAPVLLADGAKPLEPDQQIARVVEVPQGSVLIVRAAGEGQEHFALERLGSKRDGVAIPKVANANNSKAVVRVPRRHRRRPDDPRARRRCRAAELAVQGDRRPAADHRAVAAAQGNAARRPETHLQRQRRLPRQFRRGLGRTPARAAGQHADRHRRQADPAALRGTQAGACASTSRKSGKQQSGTTHADLAAHPWSGLEVELKLTARDQAGNVGESKPLKFVLPGRRFSDPLARALVEQRRILALEPAKFQSVRAAIDALTRYPDLFIPDSAVYLGLRSVYWRLNYQVTAGGPAVIRRPAVGAGAAAGGG